MPEKLKCLHMGKSLADLKKHFEIDGIIKGKKAKMLCSTAHKIYTEAEKHRLTGDEENSYINYMKYLTIVTAVQKTEEYKKEKDNYNQVIGSQNVKLAMDMAEKLSKSLEQRYELLQEQEKTEAAQVAQEERDAKEELNRKQAKFEKPVENTNVVNGIPATDEVSISSRQLFTLLMEKKMNILILDSRSSSCYAQSHMNFGNCINVPEDIVKGGISAHALEKSLPPASKKAWSQRKNVDLVVLLDWSTSEKSHQPGTNLYTLKHILLKWDPEIIYKKTPLILEGGYEDWLMTYPMHTTNPQVKRPMLPSHSELDDLLDDVEYPNLNEGVNVVLQPTIDRSSKPPLGKGSLSADRLNTGRPSALDSVSGGHHKMTGSSSDRMNSIQRPGVDRGSKSAALQTYEERNRGSNEWILAKETQAYKSQEIEESKLRSEKEWEMLRISKEKEAEEERVQLLQEREEELLLNISKLKENQRVQEAEKEQLKDQLLQYKKLQEEEAEKGKLEAQQEQERKRLAEEQLSKARERKNAEERQLLKDAEKAKKLEEKRKEKEREKQDNDKSSYYTRLKSEGPASSSNMKRSHSSPNIAQMMDDIDLGVKQKAPQFDRTIKPLQKPLPTDINAARQRNFNAVWGSVGTGLTGLKNLGNSCYMNSIIQCINNTTPLASYFCGEAYRDDVNHQNNITHGEVAEEVAAVVRALWFGHYRSIACRDLKNVVGQHRKQFQGCEQQDSHEFLTILMDWLHEDLNKQSRKSPLKETSSENLSAADRAWNQFRRSNESLIRTLFYGQQKSTVRCCKCNEESVTYEPFSDLSLPLPSSSNKSSLKDCLTLYLTGEKITGWNCPSCKEKRDAMKKFDIWRFPPILVIHLNRFYHDGWWRKRQTSIDFPFNMDMSSSTPVSGQRYVNYNLYGVSNHYGTMEGGHYTAYCKNHVYGKWYKFDDHEVSDIPINEVRSGAAYILFYASVEYKVPGNSS